MSSKGNLWGDPGLSEVKDDSSLNRRQFLKALGGGIIIFFTYDEVALSQEGRRPQISQELPGDFNAFLRIGPDGRVTCFTGKVELGQGIITSLAQMLAEELDAPLNSVDMVMGDTDLCPWDMGTFGSRTTKFFGLPLREAAAEARAVLLQLASEHLGLPIDRLHVAEGVVIDRNHPEKRVTYGQLAQGKIIERRLEKKPVLRPVAEFTLIGKPVSRTDALEKVTGRAKYAGDIHLPGMMYARILRPPAHGSRLRNVDIASIKKVKELRIIQERDLTAVLHPHPDEAEKVLNQIKAHFSSSELNGDEKTIFAHLLKTAPSGDVVAQGGDLTEGERLSTVTFERTYFTPYVAHAPIETHTATAKIEGNKATVWASTQRPFAAREEVAQALGFSPKNVRIITPFVGGGFGGKSRNRQVVEAARLAKLAKKPVQVAWSREEEFFYDTFQPAAIVRIRSGINGFNQIAFWDYNVYFAGERGSAQFYDIPHHRTSVYGTWWGIPGAHPFETGTWRAPACNTNTFARESHIDIMAAKVGIDPLEFRLKHLKDQRMKRVLEAVSNKFGWTPSKSSGGRGIGVACGIYLGTYVATMAEVEVNKTRGIVQVKRVACAQDMGQVINPEGARLQMEGAIQMGLGYALSEEIHFKDGKILDLNFDSYEIPRFSWIPKIETVLVDSPDVSPQGGGEPPITCMGAVIANAVFDATGARVLQLPMTRERIKKALS